MNAKPITDCPRCRKPGVREVPALSTLNETAYACDGCGCNFPVKTAWGQIAPPVMEVVRTLTMPILLLFGLSHSSD